jgi:hypothetical protein
LKGCRCVSAFSVIFLRSSILADATSVPSKRGPIRWRPSEAVPGSLARAARPPLARARPRARPSARVRAVMRRPPYRSGYPLWHDGFPCSLRAAAMPSQGLDSGVANHDQSRGAQPYGSERRKNSAGPHLYQPVLVEGGSAHMSNGSSQRRLFTRVTLLWSSGAAPGDGVDLHAVDLPSDVAL